MAVRFGLVTILLLKCMLYRTHADLQCVVNLNSNGTIDSALVENAVSSEEIRDCLITALPEAEYISITNLTILSPYLTELKAGFLPNVVTRSLVLSTPNLARIETGFLDLHLPQVRMSLETLEIHSNELGHFDPNQLAGCFNIGHFMLEGTKLQNLTFAFTQGTSIRSIRLHNTAHLTAISEPKSGILIWEFFNTSIVELPSDLGSQSVSFRNNQNLKVLRAGVFHGASTHVVLNMLESPIEDIEPDFISMDNVLHSFIQLGGNRLGRIDKDVFEPILVKWKTNNMLSQAVYWDVDNGATSSPVDCDCSLQWLVAKGLQIYVKNALCKSGVPVDKLTQINFDCFTCPAPDGLFPDPLDCRRFYLCSNSIAYLQYCPDGLVLNSLGGVCDWPYNTPPPCGTAPMLA